MTNMTTFLTAVKGQIKTYTLTKATHIAVGTGTTAETAADTTLETEGVREAIIDSSEGTSDVVVSLFLGSTEGNGSDYTEVGAFDAAADGNMMMRRTFPAIEKTSAIDIWVDIEEQIDVTQ